MAFLRLAKSGTLSLNERSNRLERAGQRLYRFGFGESPFPPPLRVQAALQAVSHRKDYTAVAGLPELREKIAAFHSEVDGRPVAAAQVLVAPGSKPLLYNVMRVFQGAQVFVPAPCWVSYAPQARIAGHEVIAVPTAYEARWRVDPAVLDALLERRGTAQQDKLLVLNYPGNPDGLSYSRAELLALAEVLRRHRLWVIADEIYGLLHHRGAHVSLAGIYPERTLVTTGLSKWCGAGGWRLGALMLPPQAPPALHAALVGLASETYSCAAAPIQAAALTAYELDAELQAQLADQRRILAAIGTLIHHKLQRAGLRVHPPQGGFYLLLDFRAFADGLARRGITSDGELCDGLLREVGVALLPGTAFGMAADALTARLAYVDFDGQAALDGWAARADGAAHYAARMLQGIERLIDWLH